MGKARLTALALLSAIILGACGDTPPSPTPSSPAPDSSVSERTTEPPSSAPPAVTASPGPTATPPTVDVAASFAQLLGDATFSAHATLTGTTRLGKTTTAATGELDISGSQSHLVVTRRTGKRTVSVNQVNDAVSRYSSSYGLWFLDGDAPRDDLAAAVRTLSSGVADMGVETRDGQTVHHLSIDAPTILPAALELPAKGVSNVVSTVDAWALEDGTPVVISFGVTWDQVVDRKTVHGSQRLELALTDVGSDVSIPAPTQLWKLRTSKRFHYRIAYPDDWEVQPGNKKYLDAYYGFDARSVFAYRFAAHGYSLNQFSSLLTRRTSDLTGFSAVKIRSNRSAKLGPMGARVIQLSGKYKGTRYNWIVYFAVKGGYIYWLELRTDTALTKADRDLAAQFARSFSVQ